MGQRAQVAALVAGGILIAAVALTIRPAPKPEKPALPVGGIDLPSLTACGRCHLDVFDEWSNSLHAKAWTNDNVRIATKDFEMRDCRNCHSPMPSLANVNATPTFRDFNRDDGVHCLSCHGVDGGVAATRDVSAPCNPRRVEGFGNYMSCNPCHQPTHDAVAEYVTSQAFAKGVQCVNCHMPEVPREGGRPGRFHGPHGGLNPDFAKSGVRTEAHIKEGTLVVTLRNQTGHKFPGEIPSRSFVVLVSFDDTPPHRTILRKPNKGETAWTDNRLAPDETRELRYPLPVGATNVDVRFLWKPFPLMADDDAWSFDSISLTP